MKYQKKKIRNFIVTLIIFHVCILVILPICISKCNSGINNILVNIFIISCIFLFMMPFILFTIYNYEK